MAIKQVFNTSAELDYPTVLPTLDLDFANSKTLDPRIDFTRASGGSYVGADGLIKYAGVNEPRFDHDPETGESLGLLIEESRSNLLTNSQDFITDWGKPAGTKLIPNATIAPDGTLTATKLAEDTILGLTYVFKTNSVTSGITYTVSGFVKAAERTEVFLNFTSFNSAFTNNSFAFFNLISGNFRSVGSSIVNYGSQRLPNGWYRVWISATAIATVAIPIISPFFVSNGTTSFYVGDGTSGIYIWGAQLEVGTFPTSYIPTQGSTRTRQPDITSITGKNFSSWYNQDEGTVYVSQKLRAVQDTGRNNLVYLINDGSGSDYFYNATNGTNNIFAFADKGKTYSRFQELYDSTDTKTAWAYDVSGDDFKPYYNGIGATNETNNNTPSPTSHTQLELGATVVNKYCGHIQQFVYYPSRLPNSQLQSLTS